MKVLEYRTEYSQNAFGLKTGNRAQKKGIYRCRTCGNTMTLWLDYGRLPICATCRKGVEWEFRPAKIEDVSQAGH